MIVEIPQLISGVISMQSKISAIMALPARTVKHETLSSIT